MKGSFVSGLKKMFSVLIGMDQRCDLVSVFFIEAFSFGTDLWEWQGALPVVILSGIIRLFSPTARPFAWLYDLPQNQRQ